MIKEDLRLFLKKSGWSLHKLSRETGVAVSTLSLFLTQEKRKMRLDTLEKLWPILYGEKPTLKIKREG